MAICLSLGTMCVLAVHFLYPNDVARPVTTALIKDQIKLGLFSFFSTVMTGLLVHIHNKEYKRRIIEVKHFTY